MSTFSTPQSVYEREGCTTGNKQSGASCWQDAQEAALAAYEQAIWLAPRAGILHYQRARILEHMGRQGEAQDAYTTARRLGYSA